MNIISAYDTLEWLIQFHITQYYRPECFERWFEETYDFVPQAVQEAQADLHMKLRNVKVVFEE